MPARDVAVQPTLRPGAPGSGAAVGVTAAALVAAAAPAGDPSGAGFTTDPHALVAYSRSAVLTGTRDGVPGELNVASAGLKRPAEGFLMAPLEVLHPTSPFGLRTSPLSGVAGEFHWGQDFAADCGTRVYAADAGVVRAVGWHPWGGGNRVEIDHGNGLITTYNHLEAIAVKKGDSVRVGEVIARVGTTGSSTGCHLHFETILNGAHRDPRDWTFLPTTQTDQLGTIAMTSYAPDAGSPTNASLGWAIPVSGDGRHEVANGAQEVPAAMLPRVPSFTASPSPSGNWDALSPTKQQSFSATAGPGPTQGTSAAGSTPPSAGTSTGSASPAAPQEPATAAPPPASTVPPPATPSPQPTAPPAPPVAEPAPPSGTPPVASTPPSVPSTPPAPPVAEPAPSVVTPPPVVVPPPPPPPPVVTPPVVVAPPPPPVVAPPPPPPVVVAPPPPVVVPPPPPPVVVPPAPVVAPPPAPTTGTPVPSASVLPSGTAAPPATTTGP